LEEAVQRLWTAQLVEPGTRITYSNLGLTIAGALVEAVTNAQKHAFTGRGGDLKVRFFVRGDTSVLEVQDDGPGVSETFRAGVGRTLMGAFAKQLRGSVELVPAEGGGTVARMSFATPEAIVPTDPADLGTAAASRR
jgi:two-component sensor histidine kinase